jgi:hypothetical protein
VELLGYLGCVESRFGPYADSANLDARLVHGLRRTWTHLMELLGDVGHVECCFGPFEYNISAGARELNNRSTDVLCWF